MVYGLEVGPAGHKKVPINNLTLIQYFISFTIYYTINILIQKISYKACFQSLLVGMNTEKDLIHHSKGDELERRKKDKTDLTRHSKGDGLEKKEKDKKDL